MLSFSDVRRYVAIGNTALAWYRVNFPDADIYTVYAAIRLGDEIPHHQAPLLVSNVQGDKVYVLDSDRRGVFVIADIGGHYCAVTYLRLKPFRQKIAREHFPQYLTLKRVLAETRKDADECIYDDWAKPTHVTDHALERFQESHFDAVFDDVHMEVVLGLELSASELKVLAVRVRPGQIYVLARDHQGIFVVGDQGDHYCVITFLRFNRVKSEAARAAWPTPVYQAT